MSISSRAEKNIGNLSPRLNDVGTLKNIPVVLTDSKGRYLEEQSADTHPQNKVIWWVHSGQRVNEGYEWLQNRAEKTFRELPAVFRIFLAVECGMSFLFTQLTRDVWASNTLPIPVTIASNMIRRITVKA